MPRHIPQHEVNSLMGAAFLIGIAFGIGLTFLVLAYVR